MLSNSQQCNEKLALAVRDAVAEYQDFLHTKSKPHHQANIRQGHTTVKTYLLHETGYAQYRALRALAPPAKRSQTRSKSAGHQPNAPGDTCKPGATRPTPVKKQRGAKPLKPQQYYEELLNNYTRFSHTAEHITSVEAMVNCTAHKAGKRPKSIKRISESQLLFKVQWSPCVQPGYLIEAALACRYRLLPGTTPTIATAQDMQEVGMTRPCEFCTSAVTADTPANQILECSVCQRVYHTACVPVAHAVTDGQPRYICAECSKEGYTTDTLPPELRLYKVTFAPTEEPKDRVATYGTAAAQAQLAGLETTHAAEAAKSEHDRPKKQVKFNHITAAPTERLYDVTIGQQLRRKLVIHTTPTNPHTDIHPLAPTCKFALYVRSVVCPSADPADGAHVTARNVACIYQQDGRCLHMLEPSAATRLSMSYLHIIVARNVSFETKRFVSKRV
jgi:hypothetical protein